MIYPLVRELAMDGVPVAVTCRVLKIARQPFYRWLAQPVTEAELIKANRAKILDATTRAFAKAGFAATGLDDVAAEAGITRVILYRHFDSKTDLYRAVLDHACARLTDAVGMDDFDEHTLGTLVRAAADDPDGFRLLFRYAAREPEFRDITDALAATSTEVSHRNLTATLPDGPWTRWAATLLPTLTTEAVIAWLDAGRPDPDQAADRIAQAVHGVIAAAAQP